MSDYSEMTDEDLAVAVAKRKGWTHVNQHGTIGISPSDKTRRFIPAYVTSIAAAWELVEELRKAGWDVSIDTMAESSAYRVMVSRQDDPSEAYSTEGPAPRSIAIAYLQATQPAGEGEGK